MDQLSFLTGPPVAIGTSRKKKSSKPPKPSRDATHCHGCGEAMPPRVVRRGQPRKWCQKCAPIAYRGKNHQPKGPITKPCAGCGVEITGPSYKRWCSEECARKHRSPQAPPAPRPPRHCQSCGTELPHNARSNRKWCDAKCAPWYGTKTKAELVIVYWKPAPLRKWVAGYCAECDQPFVTNVAHGRFCSAPCAARNKRRARDQRRRARKRGEQTESIDLLTVARRDNWRCHLCRQPVDRSTWSLDHLVPLSLEGQHNYDNVALAHRLCNAIRAARPLKETQAVITAVHARIEHHAS